MRLTLLGLLLLIGLGACATATSTPPLSDAERCRRFSGSWSGDTCRTGAP
jgi:hypothetical protein